MTEPLRFGTYVTGQNLYRICGFERLVQIIEEKQIFFAHPSSWDDPYESVVPHRLSNAIFAQCWCRRSTSDAMWRIYSPDSRGIRIESSRQALINAMTHESKRTGLKFDVRKVDYFDQAEFSARIRSIEKSIRARPAFDRVIEPLFVKRKPYDHELETRLVVFDERLIDTPPKHGISVPIEPFEIIKSVEVDPRAPEAFVAAFRHYLKERLNFPGSVSRSDLYSRTTSPTRK